MRYSGGGFVLACPPDIILDRTGRGAAKLRQRHICNKPLQGKQQAFEYAQSDLGIGNRLQLLDDEVLANLSDIQTRNGLRPLASVSLSISPCGRSDKASKDFAIERWPDSRAIAGHCAGADV